MNTAMWALRMHMAWICDCVRCIMEVLLRASQRWPDPPPHEPYNTCIWSLGIDFPLVKFYLHLPRVFTGMNVKVARKGDAALGIAAGADSFSPPLSHLSPLPLSLSLFLPFLMFLLIPSFSPPSLLVKGKRWHLGCCLASTVSSFLFFMGGLVERARETEREWEKQRNYSVLTPPCLFSLISTSCPLLSHRADLHSSPFFPFNSPLLLPLFSSYLCLSFLVDNADMHPCTHAGARTRKDGITGSSRWKDYLLNQQETVSNSESIVTALSI